MVSRRPMNNPVTNTRSIPSPGIINKNNNNAKSLDNNTQDDEKVDLLADIELFMKNLADERPPRKISANKVTRQITHNGLDDSSQSPISAGSNGALDNDDPTNTAMMLDENDEAEFRSVQPGTPMAYNKLGMLTVNSITRQRNSHTPARAIGIRTNTKIKEDHPMMHAVPRDALESPTKAPKRTPETHELLENLHRGLRIRPSLTQDRNVFDNEMKTPTRLPHHNPGNNSQDQRSEDVSIPQSVLRVRSSIRASATLDKIKKAHSPVSPKNHQTFSQMLTSANPTLSQRPISLEPMFEDTKFAPLGSTQSTDVVVVNNQQPDTTPKQLEQENKQQKQQQQQQMIENRKIHAPTKDVHTPNKSPLRRLRITPPEKPSAVKNQISDTGLIINKSKATESPDAFTKKSYLSTITQDVNKVWPIEAVPETPYSEKRKRIDYLKDFFINRNKTELNVTPIKPPVFGASQRSVRYDDGLMVKSLFGKKTHKSNTNNQNGYADKKDSTVVDPCNSSFLQQSIDILVGSLEVSQIGNDNGMRGASDDILDKPIAYDLNKHMNRKKSGDSSLNLIDLSSRLNASISILNENMTAYDSKANELSSIHYVADESGSGAKEAAESASNGPKPPSQSQTGITNELESEVSRLRQTMETTREIVFEIQHELDQQRNKKPEGSDKLDSIMKLLNGLDLRINLLEERGRQNARGPLNSGSIKNRQVNKPHDTLSRIGDTVMHCLTRYPLMTIGFLVVIFVLELVIMGNVRASHLDVKPIAKYMVDELSRHIPIPLSPS